MIPIYFPSMYISEQALTALMFFFPRLAVYSAMSSPVAPHMQRQAENGRLEIRVPVRGENTELMGMIRSYKEWAQLHQGKNLSYFKTVPGNAPFMDDNATPQILSAIRKGNVSDKDRELSDDRKALLFLQFAHEFDAGQAELLVDLSAIDDKQKQLFQAIEGRHEETDGLLADAVAREQEDPGAYMISQRMNAWNRLLQHDKEPHNLFVTTSRTALEFVLDHADRSEMIETVAAPLPHTAEREAWNNRFDVFLRELLQNTERRPYAYPAPGTVNGDIGDRPLCSLYRLSGQSPKSFFNRFSTFSEPVDSLPANGGQTIPNTLLALVEKRS